MKVEDCSVQKDRAFVLFACCVPVRGARRSVICDLQRRIFYFIPGGLYAILTENPGKGISAIKAEYNHEYDREIEDYFSFLIDKELGFWCSEPERFPALDLTWQSPERITNAILDIDSKSDHDYTKLFRELDDLGCKAIEVRFFRPASLAELSQVIDEARLGRLRSIEIVVGWSDEITPDALEKLVTDHPRVQGILVHSSPKPFRRDFRTGVVLLYSCEVVDSPACCGQIHAGYFATNIDTFIEAQSHNSCLNRKISIDARGDIKNCPSLGRSFGNFRDVSLYSALAQRDFSDLWLINKDQIEICKDCEFRYICTDCRAYLTEPGNLYSKPAKCTYDPYTAQWKPPSAQEN